MRTNAVLSVVVLGAFGLPPASAGPTPAGRAAAAPENGSSVTVPAAPTRLKRATCRAANRTVTITASASKRISGRTYGVEATRALSLCTTRKNQTKVYASELSLKPISGLVKVTVEAGTTTRVVKNGVTTLTTPLTAKGKVLFVTYRVAGTLRTVVDRAGKVVSQVVNVARV